MILRVSRIIENKSPPLEEVKTLVRACTSNTDFHFVVIGSSDISILMGNIGRQCSLTDIGLLETVVEGFRFFNADDYISDYKTELDKLCQRLSLDLHLEERLAAVESEIVTYLFDWKPYDYMLNDITDILSKVSAGKLFKIKYINTD